MSEFYRATVAEPSESELVGLFNTSTRDQWIHDQESNVYTFKENMNLFAKPNERGGYKLVYGYMDLIELTEQDVLDHLRPSRVMF